MKRLFTIVFFLISASCFPQAGTLDETFGDSGKVSTDIDGQCFAAALQSDGKILVGGYSNYYEYALIRYLSDGRLDSSFGANGVASVKASQFGSSVLHSITLLSDGGILTSGATDGDGLAVKFKEDGSVDSSFGNNGLAHIDFGELEVINAMQVQNDNKIILGGFTRKGVEASLNMFLVRLNPNGTVDEAFGDEGRVMNKSGLEFTCLTIQQDGKIVAGGHLNEKGAGAEDKFLITRYNTDGILDSSFGVNGSVFTDISDSANDLPYGIKILSDGKIVAAGVAHYVVGLGRSNMAAVKYNVNGTLDDSFGENGISNVFFDGLYSEARGLLVQSDGRLILGGFVYIGSVYDFALVRLTSDGIVDSSFGINGRQVTDFGGADRSNASVLQNDGKIVLAGDNGFLPANYELARYLNDAALPLRFTYFNATPTNKGTIALNWETAQEINNNYFSIERSSNNNFREIATVTSQGNSSQAQTYSYADNEPLHGTNFYRLKQVDKDGKFSYSQVASATIQNGLAIVLYPNPVRDVLNIRGLDGSTKYDLRITNAQGSLVAHTSISNTSFYSWNLKSLSAGVYYLNLVSANKITTVKFVKE